jgi:hypothetical protein
MDSSSYLLNLTQSKKVNHQPLEKHELFIRNSSFIREVGVGRPSVCRGKFSFQNASFSFDLEGSGKTVYFAVLIKNGGKEGPRPWAVAGKYVDTTRR